MQYQRDVLVDAEGIEEPVEVDAVLHEAVGARARYRQLVGVTEADEIRCNATPEVLDVRDHVSPQER